jgi:hypothetical protein
MAMAIGQVIRAQRRTYRVVEALKYHTVFKAHAVLASSITLTSYALLSIALSSEKKLTVRNVVLKPELSSEQICPRRRRKNYQIPAVGSCNSIQELYGILETGSKETTDN